MDVGEQRMNLQLFGGGGGKSGLGGGGGGGSGERGYHTYEFIYIDRQGKKHKQQIDARNQKEAERKAHEFRERNKDVWKLGRPKQKDK